jgi:uncharacterized protein with HEPN domain
MPNRDDGITLRQILDHAKEAENLVANLQRDDLENQRIISLALVHLCQIVGEAATRVTQETRVRYPEIPWSKIISFRNRLIHGYDVIDYDIFWRILTVDLPGLISNLEKILSEWDVKEDKT